MTHTHAQDTVEVHARVSVTVTHTVAHIATVPASVAADPDALSEYLRTQLDADTIRRRIAAQTKGAPVFTITDMTEVRPASDREAWAQDGVTMDAIRDFALRGGGPNTVALIPGRRTAAGFCSVCQRPATILTGGRAGNHRIDGVVCDGVSEPVLTRAQRARAL